MSKLYEMEKFLFDEEYYKTIYPEVRESKLNPIQHYKKIGWKKGYNPSPFLNTKIIAGLKDFDNSNDPIQFIIKNPNNVKQYLKEIKYKDRDESLGKQNEDISYYIATKHRIFDRIWYQNYYPDIINKCDPIQHYRDYGRFEGRLPSEIIKHNIELFTNELNSGEDLILNIFNGLKSRDILIELLSGKMELKYKTKRYFDDDYYIHLNEDCVEYKINAFIHYILLGWKKGKNGIYNINTNEFTKSKNIQKDKNPVFNMMKYDINEILIDFETNEIDKEILNQISDNIYYFVKKYNLFDERWYLSIYPDVELSSLTASEHYRKYGVIENRNPNPYINCELIKNAINVIDTKLPILYYFIKTYWKDKNIVQSYINIIYENEILNEQIDEMEREIENKSNIIEKTLKMRYDREYMKLQAEIDKLKEDKRLLKSRYDNLIKISVEQIKSIKR